MNIREALSFGNKLLKRSGISTNQLDTEVILCHALGIERSVLFAHFEKKLSHNQLRAFNGLIRQRCKRMPVAYLIGHKEFFGYDFVVSPDVLIPRPDTETLVNCVLDYLAAHPDKRTILDIGSGSGCIAVSIAMSRPNSAITCTDASQRAIRIAQLNIKKYELENRVFIRKADVYPTIPRLFDVIISNPPYLSLDDYRTALIKYPELRYEPRSALIAPQEGVALIERIIATCKARLRTAGALFLEIGSGQRMNVNRIVRTYCTDASLSFHKDLAGRTRVARLIFG